MKAIFNTRCYKEGVLEIVLSCIFLTLDICVFAAGLSYYVVGIVLWEKHHIWYPLWIWVLCALAMPLFLITLFDGFKKYRLSRSAVMVDETFSQYGDTNTEDDPLTEVSSTSSMYDNRNYRTDRKPN
jgi:hypothetical protein